MRQIEFGDIIHHDLLFEESYVEILRKDEYMETELSEYIDVLRKLNDIFSNNLSSILELVYYKIYRNTKNIDLSFFKAIRDNNYETYMHRSVGLFKVDSFNVNDNINRLESFILKNDIGMSYIYNDKYEVIKYIFANGVELNREDI